MSFRTIHESRGFLGGYAYRATSNGEQVNLQSRPATASAWKTEATVTAAEFAAEVERRGMDSPYGGDSPSHVYSIIEATKA